MKVRNMIATVLYIVLGAAFILAVVFAISTAYGAPFALSVEHYVTVELAYYDFDLLAFCQNIMIGVAIALVIILVFLDERASRKLKRQR
jgi:hypothetical protein